MNGLRLSLRMTSLVFMLVVLLISPFEINAKVKEKSKLSYGVQYEKLDYRKSSIRAGVDKLEIDVSDQFTEVQLGKPVPLDNLTTVRNRVKSYHKGTNNVVGAINANFYLAQKNKDTRPVHLISDANRLIYKGYVNEGKENLINEPIA